MDEAGEKYKTKQALFEELFVRPAVLILPLTCDERALLTC